MKASQFKGVDYAVMRKFKAPIEKFDEINDFYHWSKNLITGLAYQHFPGRQQTITEQRKDLLYKWFYHFTNNPNTYTPAMFLLAFAAITKNLKPNTDTLPPELNEIALIDSFSQIEEFVNSNNDEKVDFYKIYQNKLRKTYLDTENVNTNREDTLWVKIHSKQHDPKNYEANVKKLKELSYRTWCTTKTSVAKSYLNDGDFHIFFVNEKPKLAIRMIGDSIQEIQGEQNNASIPLRYYDEFVNYCRKNQLNKTASGAKAEIYIVSRLHNILEKYEDAIKKQDFDTLLDILDISFTKDKNGFYTLYPSEVNRHEDFSPFDLSLDVDKLFKKVKILNASDESSTVYRLASYATSLGAIEEIHDDLYLKDLGDHHLKDLGNLKKVHGDVNLKNTRVRTLGQLKFIEGNLYLEDCYVTDLSGIEEFHGTLAKINLLQLLNPKNYSFIRKHYKKIFIEKSFGPLPREIFNKFRDKFAETFPWLT